MNVVINILITYVTISIVLAAIAYGSCYMDWRRRKEGVPLFTYISSAHPWVRFAMVWWPLLVYAAIAGQAQSAVEYFKNIQK